MRHNKIFLKGKMNQKIAIVSAGGEIAELLIKEIKEAQVYEIDPKNPPDLPELAERLKGDKITDVVFSGKVDKRAIFSSKIDFAKKDDISILKDISLYFATQGIKVRNQLKWLKRFLAKEGIITGRISMDEDSDIKFGFFIAKKLVSAGVGQTVCVKNGLVVAVEALEGTDETILRAGSLVSGFVVVKCGKKGSLELPAIGKKTILAMKKAGAKAIAVQAERVLLLPDVVGLAKEYRISIIGVK